MIGQFTQPTQSSPSDHRSHCLIADIRRFPQSRRQLPLAGNPGFKVDCCHRPTDETAREGLLCDALNSHVCRPGLCCLARDLRRTDARGMTPTGIRLSKSRVSSIACGMLNSNIRSKSIEPAARSIFPMS